MDTAMGTTKFSMMSNKMQLGAAALAVATAASFTPAIANATPNLAPIAEAIGGGASLLVDPVTITPGNSVSTSAAADPCATAGFQLGCYTVAGVVAGTQAIVRGAVIFIGTIAYVVVQFTGQILKLVGALLGPFGAIFTAVGDGVLVLANAIAEALHVGPYLTA